MIQILNILLKVVFKGINCKLILFSLGKVQFFIKYYRMYAWIKYSPQQRNEDFDFHHLQTVGLLESLEEKGEVILDAYLSLARFADGQYQHIVNYMKSSTYEAKQTLMLKAKKEMARILQLGESEEDLLKKEWGFNVVHLLRYARASGCPGS